MVVALLDQLQLMHPNIVVFPAPSSHLRPLEQLKQNFEPDTPLLHTQLVDGVGDTLLCILAVKTARSSQTLL